MPPFILQSLGVYLAHLLNACYKNTARMGRYFYMLNHTLFIKRRYLLNRLAFVIDRDVRIYLERRYDR